MKIVLKKAVEAAKPRAKSAVGFPYFDFDSSLAVAKTIRDQGGSSGLHDQIAHWLGYQSIKSGTYLTRVAAAKQFGLVASTGSGLAVSDLALSILAPVMPTDAASAKARAFLNVELFSKVNTDFHGRALPPPMGLQNLFQNTYGIVPDRVQQAVRVFLSSASQTGYLVGSGDSQRLVTPVSGSVTPAAATEVESKGEAAATPVVSPDKQRTGGGSGTGGEGPPGIHTAIIGLLRDLPAPGTVWPFKAKARFMAAFKANIDHIYPEEADS